MPRKTEMPEDVRRMTFGRDDQRHNVLLGEFLNPTKDNKFLSGMGPLHLTESDIKGNQALSGLHEGWYDTHQVTRPQYEGRDGTVYMPGLAVKGPQQTFKEGDGIGFGTANKLGWTKPNEWISDSREKPFTDQNTFGEPISKPRFPKPTMASKGGNAPGESKSSGVPSGHNPALDGYSGPRIVINPSTFKNEKDGLCVAFDEAFRILMEVNGFDPVAEPTEKQREFFSDTAYANDERMLRRTILARICTFDTSVTDPTDEQLQEAVEFLETVMEIGAPQNEWEQSAVQRIRDTVERAIGQPAEGSGQPEKPEGSPVTAAGGGGATDDEKNLDQQQQEQQEQDIESEDPISELEMPGTTDNGAENNTSRDAQKPTNDSPAEAQDAVRTDNAGRMIDDHGRVMAGQAPQTQEQTFGGKIDNAGRMLDDHGRVMAGQAPQTQEQTFGGKIDNAGRMLDDHGRVMAGQTPAGHQPTSGEQQWAANREASTEAYIQRKLEREERRMANHADRIKDREELFGKVESGKFGFDSARERNRFIKGNSQSWNPFDRTNDVLGRLYGKYHKYGYL